MASGRLLTGAGACLSTADSEDLLFTGALDGIPTAVVEYESYDDDDLEQEVAFLTLVQHSQPAYCSPACVV